MKKITSAMIDLSGTLHIEDKAIEGAQEAIARLRRSSIGIRFVTNTTKESMRLLKNRLTSLNFVVNDGEIYSSLSAAKNMIQVNNYRPFLILDDDAMEDFQELNIDNPNAVVIGLAPKKFNNETMDKAFNLIKNNNADLIAIHKGRYYQKKDGLHLGPGAYVAGLEYATGVQAKVVGKPEELFYKSVFESFNSSGCSTDKWNSVMIGDDVNDDVIGAINMGVRAILVKTGKYREGDEMKIPLDKRNVASSIVEAVDMIIDDIVN